MDPEIVKLIHQAVQSGLASASWIVMIGGIIAAGIGAWLGSYLKSKGEHLATKEDFDELIRQVSAQTKATETIKAEVAEKLAVSTESLKTELSVWAGFRNDVLKQMWSAHRAVVDAMTNVILRTQQAEATKELSSIETEITSYRQCVHRSLDVLSPRAIDLTQMFLMTAYNISRSVIPANDANPLKKIRWDFTQDMALRFHLGEVMPWMISGEQTNDRKKI
jgi:hypothetical protein